MKHKLYILSGIITLFLAVAAVVIAGTMAQSGADEITLSVSPPVFELSANPGDVVENKIRVTNLSDEAQVILVDKRNFTALGEEGGVDLTEEDTSYSLASWVSVDKERTTIPARESEVFDFTVAIPANAEPGGHFGSLIFKTEVQPLEEGGSAAAVGQEIGSLLLVKVAGDINEDAALASFESLKGFYERGPVTFETRVENVGNVHFKPRGTVTINNILGREVATLQLDERNVLPGAIRKVDTEWDDSSFRMGRYTANLSLVYGSENSILNSSTSFTILPYKLVLPLLAGLAIAALVIYRYRSRFREAFKALAGKH